MTGHDFDRDTVAGMAAAIRKKERDAAYPGLPGECACNGKTLCRFHYDEAVKLLQRAARGA